MTTPQTCDQEMLAKRTYHFELRQRERGISDHDVVLAIRCGNTTRYIRDGRQFRRYDWFDLVIIQDVEGRLVTTCWV